MINSDGYGELFLLFWLVYIQRLLRNSIVIHFISFFAITAKNKQMRSRQAFVVIDLETF